MNSKQNNDFRFYFWITLAMVNAISGAICLNMAAWSPAFFCILMLGYCLIWARIHM